MSREWTQEEIQHKFLHHLWAAVKYWEEQTEYDSKRKLEGLMHTFLATLDGCTADLPGFDLVARPHPSDKQYCIDNDENYYPENKVPEDTVTVHGNDSLHEIMYKFGRKYGFLPAGE